MDRRTRQAIRNAPTVVLIACAAVGQERALNAEEVDIPDMRLFRFEFDNDTFVGSDDAFSAGWSIHIDNKCGPKYWHWPGQHWFPCGHLYVE